ncbi:hypothetical protein GCM10027168_24750 [Streptomyces capparidis]
MSYLGYPRLHFSGTFVSDPSTVNNTPEHYDNDAFHPRFQRPGPGNGDWNPRGGASFRLEDCAVTSVIRADGTVVTSPALDPLVGGALIDDGQRVSAKIQDLDPMQQGVSQIWGLRLALSDSAGRRVLSGDFAPASFDDLWQRSPAPGGLERFSAAFQSVITLRPRPADGSSPSPFAAELLAAAGGGEVSIRFTLDGYQPDADSPRFTTGRVVGSLGPAAPGEPRHFVAARRLRSTRAGLTDAPCRLDERHLLHIDLGNSVPTRSPGGPPADLGPVLVALLPPGGGEPEVLGELGPVDADFLTTFAGIATVRLPDDRAERGRLALTGPGGRILLAESADAGLVRADVSVFRLQPPVAEGRGPRVRFHATRFGRPAPGVTITFDNASLRAERRHSDDPSLVEPPLPADAPGGLLPVPPVTTDDAGLATVRLAATDPGNPRRFIDGRIHTLDYGRRFTGDGGGALTVTDGQLNVLVWNEYRAPEEPAWIPDIQPILQQYANLYPVMRGVLDMSDYHQVVRYRDRLRYVLSEPMESPAHMPVTRDLSPAKRDAVLAWLDRPRPRFLAIRDAADLRRVLQLALRLEHATIPPYLYALFSLKPGRNREVADIIRSVVLQEMLHMALVANVLTAVDGRPRVGRPGFVPQYPTQLPAGVLPGLVVRLRRCSPAHVREVFMGIEKPDRPLTRARARYREPVRPEGIELDGRGDVVAYRCPDAGRDAPPPAEATAPADLADQLYAPLRTFFEEAVFEEFTIGWFYREIADAIARLGDGVFTGADRPQVVEWPGTPPGNLFRVKDVGTAQSALYEIVHQGEGTVNDPNTGGEPAHYYRFQQIVKGRRLIEKDGAWVFEGEPVPFDPDGVHPLVDDPDTSALPADSPGRAAARRCDRIYGELLSALDRVFGGDPAHLQEAVSLMHSVQVRAKELVRHPSAPGAQTVLGPSFQV